MRHNRRLAELERLAIPSPYRCPKCGRPVLAIIADSEGCYCVHCDAKLPASAIPEQPHVLRVPHELVKLI
jgi:hypothetical protein